MKNLSLIILAVLFYSNAFGQDPIVYKDRKVDEFTGAITEEIYSRIPGKKRIKALVFQLRR